MTLRELKQQVDRLCAEQDSNLDTNVTRLYIVDNGDWRFLQVDTAETRTLTDKAKSAFDHLQRVIDFGPKAKDQIVGTPTPGIS